VLRWKQATSVIGVTGLRVAGASVIPNVISGNSKRGHTMIGEKAAQTITDEPDLALDEFVGKSI
jgi:choline dehydrogenase-like flavoprotein